MSYEKSKDKSNELLNQLESAHQSPNKTNSSKSPSSAHLLNGTPKYHQNVNTNTSEVNNNLCETNKNIPQSENQQCQSQNKKQTFVGNLNNDLNIKDLRELFGLLGRKLQHQYNCKPEDYKKPKVLHSNCVQTMSIMNCLNLMALNSMERV